MQGINIRVKLEKAPFALLKILLLFFFTDLN